MAIIVGIKFKGSNKVYYFDPQDIEFAEGDGVIVETARGQEYGTVALPNREVEEKEVVSPLKPVIRKATAEDERQLKRTSPTVNPRSKPSAKRRLSSGSA